MRNPNSSGSVYKLKGRRRCPWVARVTNGWTTTTAKSGKRKGEEVSRQQYTYIGYYPTKKDALDALTLHRTGHLTPKNIMTVKEVYDEWAGVAFSHVSSHTQRSYKQAWAVLSKLSHLPFAELRTKQWQELLDSSPLGYSAKMKMRTVISQLYSYAGQNDIVSQNYAKYLRLTRDEKKEKNVFTDLEIKKMFDHIQVEGIDTILILIYTGFRITELLELTKFNVDLNAGIIRGGKKTEAGRNRLVPIHPKILPLIKKHLNRDGETLICREDGQAMTADKYRKKIYYPALQAVGIEERPPHTCRHTFGTLAAKAGIDSIIIQRMMGHSNYSFTADNYTHPQIEEYKNAISKI